MLSRKFFVIVALLFSLSCANQEPLHTLRTIDKVGGNIDTHGNFISPKSEEEIRQAYANYIKHTDKQNSARLSAITRLAEIEFEISERLRQEHTDDGINGDLAYLARLNKTIELLTTSLNDYPNAKNNDQLLYQLAKVCDQKGDYQCAIDTLQKLVLHFPKSSYYVEAQFRIGEQSFASGDYISAEDAYTEVIISQQRNIFYEKSIFKRGWARLKQELYNLAVDDFMEAVMFHRFDEITKLGKSEKEQFDEYFRSIGLAFSYLGGATSLPKYFQGFREFKYIYHTYAMISDIYLKQERYYDAADTLQQFIQIYQHSEHKPSAHLKIIETWQQSGFIKKLHNSIEQFYTDYNPDSQYWANIDRDHASRKIVATSLKKYTLLICSYFHSQYQKSHKKSVFTLANTWYQRYMQYYSAFARQDDMYFLYAELLSLANKSIGALKYYELAAYDGELMLNKDAAYATILISSQLYKNKTTQKKEQRLDQHINYSLRFSKLYPSDPKSDDIILHASDLAFSHGQFERTIDLTRLIRDGASDKAQIKASKLKAQSLFRLQRYSEAEETYLRMLGSGQVRGKNQRNIEDSLALSIYQQAESAKQTGARDQAYTHYSRIVRLAQKSDIAATGLYDAIAIAMQDEKWNLAIDAIKLYQQYFPKHQYHKDVTKKLSVAYLKSNRDIEAAEQLEKVSNFEQDQQLKMAALWQAAELHLKKKNTENAIRLFEEYSNSYKDPFPQYLEAMNHLVEIHQTNGSSSKASRWRKKIVNANNKAYKNQKTERTQYLASSTSLYLAQQRHEKFKKIKLIAPLKINLNKKKKFMQEAVQLYGKTSAFGLHGTTTESTHAIAEIYEHFSKALLDSERPKNLDAIELEQYEILLEDQAFPFEAKAIEFYETNLGRIKDGAYNNWIEKSLNQLKILFPARYVRKEKIDSSFRIIM